MRDVRSPISRRHSTAFAATVRHRGMDWTRRCFSGSTTSS